MNPPKVQIAKSARVSNPAIKFCNNLEKPK